MQQVPVPKDPQFVSLEQRDKLVKVKRGDGTEASGMAEVPPLDLLEQLAFKEPSTAINAAGKRRNPLSRLSSDDPR